MEDHGKNNDELFPGSADQGSSPVNGTNLSDTNIPSDPTFTTKTSDSTADAVEPVNLYAQPPDMPRRLFEVTVYGDVSGRQVERVEGHIAFTEHGTLTIQQAVSGSVFTVRIFAPNEWLGVVAAPPTRRQLEAIARATNVFYMQQADLQNHIDAGRRQQALAGAAASKDGNRGNAVRSGRQLLGKGIN